MIIQIPTKNSSNEVKSFIVIFIPLQLTLGRVIECSRDHVRLIDDFSNVTTLAQKIVASSVFPVTEILVIEHNKLDCTFLHVAFGS
jgi:L-rhamnose isomerase